MQVRALRLIDINVKKNVAHQSRAGARRLTSR
jgi:hypothetical protein